VLEPGTYASRVFKTRVEFTVPEGWKVFEDEPGQFGLAIVANDGPCICFWRDVRVMSASCAEEPEPGVGSTAEAIAEALNQRGGIAASKVKTVKVGGLSGVRLDLRIAPAWSKACPFSQGRPAVPTLVGSGISAGVAWDVEATDSQRLYLLDLGSQAKSGNLAINIDVCCGVDFERRMDEVTPVIESLVFGDA
jgi:hypothetical protein